MVRTGNNDEKRLCGSSGSGLTEGIRTDLACESGRRTRCYVAERIPVGEASAPGGRRTVTVTRSVEDDGRRYVTLSCGALTSWDEEALSPLSALLSREIRELAAHAAGRPVNASMRVLVVGLGNADMTPDALGPGTVRRLTVTRHLKEHDEALFGALGCCELSAVAPGVLGQTGIEAAELVREAAETVKPHLIVAVDALAARRCDRLVSTVQLSDGGICPGAGIGNSRLPIDRESMGCPVLAVGVPTVVDSTTLVLDTLERAGLLPGPTAHADSAGRSAECGCEAGGADGGRNAQKDAGEGTDPLAAVLEAGRRFIVSPRDCDRMITMSCILLARALDMAFGIDGAY